MSYIKDFYSYGLTTTKTHPLPVESTGHIIMNVLYCDSLVPLLPPTDDVLYQHSCLISDVTALAVMLNVSSDELDNIVRVYPDKNVQALQVLKKWRESTGGSHQELSQHLNSLPRRLL